MLFYRCGPAFEGANIRHGMGGIRGAINTVRLITVNLSIPQSGMRRL